VVHWLLANNDYEVVERFGVRGNRPLVYKLYTKATGLLTPLFIIGPYTSPCGGCDAITDYKNILPPLISKYARLGDVLFEGLLISGGYGSVGRKLGELRDTWKHKVVFALLDTPLETCLERVNARRRARGVMEPVNPVNTEQKYKAAHASQRKIAEEYGHECVMINHKRPVREVLSLFGVELKREPKHG
jgi:hypothetical protein